jgi:hypothetical protein
MELMLLALLRFGRGEVSAIWARRGEGEEWRHFPNRGSRERPLWQRLIMCSLRQHLI